MALTEQGYKDLIVQEMGKIGDTTFITLVDSWWQLFPFSQTSWALQYLFVKRHAIINGILSNKNYDWTEADVTRKLSQIDNNWLKLLPIFDKLIADQLASLARLNPKFTTTIRMTLNDPNLPRSFPYRYNDFVSEKMRCL